MGLKSTSYLSLGVAVALMGTACEKKKKPESADDKASASRPVSKNSALKKVNVANLKAPAFFKHIPSDAAYVFGSYEPLPADFMTAMGNLMEPYLNAGLALAEESGDPEALAISKEFRSVFTRDGLTAIGIDVTPRFAMYNIGASVVWRMELADGDKLRDYIVKTVETFGGEKLPLKTMGSMTYFESPPDDVYGVVGISKTEVAIGIMPSSVKDAVLPVLLGSKMPAKSIVDTGSLKKAIAEYGLGAYGAGYWDIEATLQLFTRGAPGVAGTEADLSSMSKACITEFEAMAGIMPMMYFGYEELSSKSMSMLMVAELRRDIAAAFEKVGTSVPAYEMVKGLDPVMSFGLGINVGSLLDWTEATATKINAAPYKCEELAEMNEAFASAAGSTAVVPALARDVSGMVASFQKFDPEDPENMAGVMAVQAKDPGAIFSLISGFVPPLGSVQLKAGGKPSSVNMAELGMPGAVSIAKGETMLGASIGKGMDSLLTKVVNTSPSKSGPFFVMTYDYAMLLDSMDLGNSDMPQAYTTAVRETIGRMGVITMEFFAAKPGLIIRYELQMK